MQNQKKQVEEFGIMDATKEKPDHTYFQIQITAENMSDEIVRLTGGQFHLYDIDDKRWPAAFVGYGEEELSVVELEQNAPPRLLGTAGASICCESNIDFANS